MITIKKDGVSRNSGATLPNFGNIELWIHHQSKDTRDGFELVKSLKSYLTVNIAFG